MDWIEQLEFGIYQLPQPDLTIWLDLPAREAQRLIARKSQRSYTDKAADLQEADSDYLEQVRSVYQRLAEQQPDWRRIDCLSAGRLRDIDQIGGEILDVVRVSMQTV
ncbi:MAG: hypothetical protein U0872_06045 [Planctomycetaceae bacterium]